MTRPGNGQIIKEATYEAVRSDQLRQEAERRAAVADALRGTEGRQARADLIIRLTRAEVANAATARVTWWWPPSWGWANFVRRQALRDIDNFCAEYERAGDN
jgi:hypothetical protein